MHFNPVSAEWGICLNNCLFPSTLCRGDFCYDGASLSRSKRPQIRPLLGVVLPRTHSKLSHNGRYSRTQQRCYELNLLLLTFLIPNLCLQNDWLSIPINFFFMFFSWSCFPHESHCSVFQIWCFQGNRGSYNTGHVCHFRPFGRQYFSEVNYLQSPRWDTVMIRSMRWLDFYNKPHYSYFKPRDLRMILVPAPNVCLHVGLNKGDSFSYVKNRKMCERSEQFLHYWP